MKRIYLLLLLAVFTMGIATAQNANRSGFFLELGIGGLVGDTPRNSISITDNTVYYKCLTGTAADFGLGGRFRTANHWAYELKLEAQLPLKNPVHTFVGRLLPVGFRYTSGELWKNYSLYAHINLGGAITACRGIYGYNGIAGNSSTMDYIKGEADGGMLSPNLPDSDLGGFGENTGFGVAYSLGVGVNITTHLYIEACLNAQVIINGFGKNGHGLLNYGTVGGVLGYRF